MNKYKILVFTFVFWWSLLCPTLGFPEDSMYKSPKPAMESMESNEDKEVHVAFQFKYLTFLNDLFH